MFHACVFTKHCKYQCFWKGVPKTLKNTAFRTCCVAKVSQIAVFWLHLRFWLLPKHRKNQCFDSILVLAEEKTSQITLFCSWWEQKTLYITMFYARCDILGAGSLWGRKGDHFLGDHFLPHRDSLWGRKDDHFLPHRELPNMTTTTTTTTTTKYIHKPQLRSCAREHRRLCEAHQYEGFLFVLVLLGWVGSYHIRNLSTGKCCAIFSASPLVNLLV